MKGKYKDINLSKVKELSFINSFLLINEDVYINDKGEITSEDIFPVYKKITFARIFQYAALIHYSIFLTIDYLHEQDTLPDLSRKINTLLYYPIQYLSDNKKEIADLELHTQHPIENISQVLYASLFPRVENEEALSSICFNNIEETIVFLLNQANEK